MFYILKSRIPALKRGFLYSVQDITDAITYEDSDFELELDETDENAFEVDKVNLQHS